MSARIAIHQAIFGYDAGHNLLAASCPLSAESRRTLAVLTDASGPWPASGFDHVYTGTPLLDMPYYAFFCTWPAPEMPRPGCVWSHVLLIELADLAGLADLGELHHCFRRPSKTDDRTCCEALRFVAKRTNAEPVARSLQRDCKRFLAALYAFPDAPFVAQAPNAETYGDLIFALWSQQWPRLRRSFRFSTGSFADRGQSGTGFDLQIAPATNRRTWQRGDNQPSLESAEIPPGWLATIGQNWIDTALNDLLAPDATGFRSFLREYGADVNSPRRSFALLTAAYDQLRLRPENNWIERLRYIGQIFPSPSEAQRLKESLITLADLPESERDFAHTWATTSFLLTQEESTAYAGLTPDYSGLASKLWHTGKKEVLSLLAQLVRQQESPAATAFASAVANLIQPDELSFISDERPELIPIIFSRRPKLAFHIDAWRLPENTQWRVYEVLQGLSLGSKEWAEIMAAMFLSATGVAVRDVVTKAGPHAMEGAFRWLESTTANELLPSQIWREALAVPAADQLRDTESLSPTKLALCSWLVAPESARQLLSASRQDIQDLAQSLDALPKPLRVPTAFLLVTLGLRDGNVEGAQMVIQGFTLVHDALASRSYFPESWTLLSPELPYLGFWSDWDRCEKLRRAVQTRFPKDSSRFPF